MKSVVIMIGAARHNRGSEALTRGCVEALRATGLDIRIGVSSKDDNTGYSLRLDGVDHYIRRYTYDRNQYLIRYPIGILRYILHMKTLTNWMNHAGLLRQCRDADLVIVIGGDNYDKSYGAFADMHSLNRTLRSVTSGKMVLLSCSIDPAELNEKIIEDLKLFDRVTVRESVTWEGLREQAPDGLVEYYPDAAFLMKPKPTLLPECFHRGDVVGINLSPLILRPDYTAHGDVVLRGYQEIIRYLTDIVGKQALLIPHVMDYKDLSALKKLYEPFQDNERVSLLEDETLQAPELKYIISRCWLFLGARTHSTIAAYSSCVPTLVLGYSVKSIGIAQDLFGTEEGYVVSVQSISQPDELVSSFRRFLIRRDEVEARLRQVMPGYLRKADSYRDCFAELLKNNKKTKMN